MNVCISRQSRMRQLPWWRKSALALLALGLMGTTANAQVLFNETFAGGASVTGFTTQVIVAGAGCNWFYNDPGGRFANGDVGNAIDAEFAIFDNDFCGFDDPAVEEAYLVSPPFDASVAGTYMLDFDQNYRFCCASVAGVDVWNGTVWTNVYTLPNATLGDPGSVPASFNITAAAGGSSVAQVRFTYAGDWAWWWALDNISVERLLCTAPTVDLDYVLDDCPGGFDIALNFTVLGSGAPYSVEYSINGTPQTPVVVNATGITTLTGFAAGDDVDIVIQHGSDDLCDVSFPGDPFFCPPPNDDCANAVPNVLGPNDSVTRTGTTLGATNTEAFGFGTTGVVWESFTLTDCVSSLVVQMCGTTPQHQYWWGFLYTDCALTQSTEVGNGVYSCVDGNLEVTFSTVPAGTYYWPIISIPGSPGNPPGPYTVTFVSGAVCPPPPGLDCTPGLTNDNDVTIEDVATVSSVINTGLQPGVMITDLNVYLDLTHTWVSDLDITLTGPDGETVIDLTSDNCGSSDDMTVEFDDQAGEVIGTGLTCPPNGVYAIPEQLLAIFNNTFLQGEWTLTITDDTGGDSGTLLSWCLIPTTIVVDCVPPTVERTYVPACPGGFGIDLDFTDLADGAPYTINYSVNGTAQAPIGPVNSTGVVSLTGFANGDDVDITIVHTENTICNVVLNDQTYTCPPPNDDCANAVLNDLDPGESVTRTGSTVGSTNAEGFGFGVTGVVWESFTLAECVQTLVVQMCGTDPVHDFYWGPIYTDCNGTESTEIESSGFTCVDGNLEITYTSMEAGTYYWPLFVAPGAVEAGDYSVTFVAGAACFPPPPNDDCSTAPITVMGAGETVDITGSSLGATDEGGELTGFSMVWHQIDLTECVNTLQLDFCGMVEDYSVSQLNAIFTACPATIASAIFATVNLNDCPNGNRRQTYTNLPAGTYYVTAWEGYAEYTMTVTTSPGLEATAEAVDDPECDAGTFDVIVTVDDDGGAAASIEWTVDGAPGVGSPLPATVGVPTDLGDFPNGVEVAVTVSNGSFCSPLDLGSFYSNCPVTLVCGDPATPVSHCYANNDTRTFTYITDPLETVTIQFIGSLAPGDAISFHDGIDAGGLLLPGGNPLTGSINTYITTSGNALHMVITSGGAGSCQDGDPGASEWNFNVQCTPDCSPGDAVISEFSDCQSYSFTLQAEITDLGAGTPPPPLTPESEIYVTYTVDGGPQAPPMGPYTIGDFVTIPPVGNFTIGQEVIVILLHDSDPLCNRPLEMQDGDENCPPPGENCSNAFVIPIVPTSVSGSTIEYQPGVPYASDYTGTDCDLTGSSGIARDVVYSYTPPVNQFLNLTMCLGTTNFDTKLYVFANSCDGAPIACDDDACSNAPTYTLPFISTIPIVAVTAGTTYYFVVDGWGADAGNYTLQINDVTPPANDDCANAVNIPTAGPFPYTTAPVDNTYGSDGADPTPLCQGNSNAGIWYTYTPAVSGAHVLSMCQSEAAGSTIPDGILSVYTSASACAGPFTSVACDDDACGAPLGLQSRIGAANLTCGTQYYILASGFGASRGNIQIRVTPPSCTPAAFNVTGGGISCGGAGVAVGLSGSNSCVSYQLFRGATPLATLPGTGAALNFGLQTVAGTYTVVATNNLLGTCTANMTGSVVVDALEPGAYCDQDPGPAYVPGQLDGGCLCGPVTCEQELELVFQTDGNPGQISWEILEQGTPNVIQSGLPGTIVAPNGEQTVFPCVPNGCYMLRVTDSGGDGITGGGYILRTNTGVRIIDNRNNFGNLPGGPPDVSQMASNGGFCFPPGPNITQPIYTSCDKLDWVTGEYLVASPVPAVAALWNAGNTPAEATSGYDFQFFNPNGGFVFTRTRTHNQADGFAPDNSSRACHMKINNWAAANQIPPYVLMNVRIRSRINGVTGNWGPTCRMKIDPVRAACPLSKLMDIPGNQYYSCGVTRAFVSSQRVTARPVTGANKYQFRFRRDSEGFMTVRTATGTNYFVNLGWTTNPLEVGKTYDVEVRVSKNNGASWCIDTNTPAPGPNFTPWGDVCQVTIVAPVSGGNQNMEVENTTGLRMYPNPNRGDQLFLGLEGIEQGVQTVSVDIYDLFGKVVSTRMIPVTDDGTLNTLIDLQGEMANGMYLVNITAGNMRFTERLVIEK